MPDHADLRVYVEDHLTGANAVIDLVRSRLDRGDPDPWLRRFLAELEQERQVLEDLADDLVAMRLHHRVLGRLATLAARVVLRLEELQHDDALRDLLEFETMRVGLEGKRALWRTLDLLRDDPVVAKVDVATLDAQAADQVEQVERRRLEAAGTALGAGAGTSAA